MAKINIEQLKKAIKKSGMTKREIAKKIGISDIYLYQILSGKKGKRPSYNVLKKLSEVLNIPISHLTEYGGSFKSLSELNNWITVPVYGEVPAGDFHPIEDEIIDEISIPKNWIKGIPEVEKNVGALVVKGKSMFPKYKEGDIIVLGRYPFVSIKNGDDVVVSINGEITLKKFFKTDNEIVLVPLNTDYSNIVIKGKDIEEQNISIFKVIGYFRREV